MMRNSRINYRRRPIDREAAIRLRWFWGAMLAALSVWALIIWIVCNGQ
ncbi:hypothetical protein [Aurantiacibacter xanthus]|nr:hypothetical protein [Aurantiacibacter xanthus]